MSIKATVPSNIRQMKDITDYMVKMQHNESLEDSNDELMSFT